MSTPGVDRPEEQSEVEVTFAGRGISVSSRVEYVSGDVIAVRPSVGAFVEQHVAAVGDVVMVNWTGPEDLRVMPAEVVDVEQGALVRWRLRQAGPSEQSQRRSSVRARVAVPVVVGYGSAEVSGVTVDLSEAGMRASLEGYGLPPEPGARLDVEVDLEDGPVRTRAEVVRQQSRGAQWLMSIRFVDIAEKQQDRLRRRVFQALREERARAGD